MAYATTDGRGVPLEHEVRGRVGRRAGGGRRAQRRGAERRAERHAVERYSVEGVRRLWPVRGLVVFF